MLNRLWFLGIIALLISCSGRLTKSVYKNDSEEKRASLLRVRSKNPYSDYLVPKYTQTIYSYYYPDSVLNRKEYFDYRYDKSLGKYLETGFETIYFKRETPYIPPIDTSIYSPVQLSETFVSRSVLPQKLRFSDSSRFEITGNKAGTSTTTPTYSYSGRYKLTANRLILYTQKDNSLEIDSALFNYYTDSMVLITENDLFRNRYYLTQKR